MSERLIDFGGAVLLIAVGNVFFARVMNLKIKRAAFMVLLCALHVLLLLPFLIWGHEIVLYGTFVLSIPLLFAAGVFCSDDAKFVIFLAAIAGWIFGAANALFWHLLHPTAQHLFQGEHATLLRLAVTSAGFLADLLMAWLAPRFLVNRVLTQMKRYANWSIVLQYAAILLFNATLLFFVAGVCAALTSRAPELAAAMIAVIWGWYAIVGGVNFLTFHMISKVSERNEIAANLEKKETEARMHKEYAELVTRNAERLSRWQHNTNDILAAMRMAVQDEKVIQMIDELGIKISVPAIPRYTGDIVLDTCLAAKAEEARKKDVRLHMQIALPSPVSMTSVELMRIFLNLLDNAIRAAAAMPDPADRAVEIECKKNAGFLYINTRNRFLEDKTPHGTGQGTVILRKFAEQYHGTFVSQPRGGEWAAMLALKL